MTKKVYFITGGNLGQILNEDIQLQWELCMGSIPHDLPFIINW